MMSDDAISKSNFQVGGTLGEKAPYVEREADRQLYDELKQGNYCHVFNCRQMGKSSLVVRTKKRLEQENYVCIIIDLQSIGSGTREQWYNSVAGKIIESLPPEVQLSFCWEDHKNFTPGTRLEKMFEAILFSIPEQQSIVIFIDEIDLIYRLDVFTDDFFTFIRYCYNQRSNNAQYKRLTFCLLGVTTPSDLIKNPNITSYNISKKIELKGFCSEDNLEPLLERLPSIVKQTDGVMQEILYWSGGQPFLTQKICNLVKENAQGEIMNIKEYIKNLIEEKIIKNWENKDEPQHLGTIQNQFKKVSKNTRSLYQKILSKEEMPADDTDSQMQLKLSGLVIKKDNLLKVFNEIYKRIFDLDWVERIEQDLKRVRPYEKHLKKWREGNEKHKNYYLLYGETLKVAEEWKDTNKEILEVDDYEFLTQSKDFWNKADQAIPSIYDKANVIERIKQWTGGDEIFYNGIFDIIKDEHNASQNEQDRNEIEWIDQLVQKKLIENREVAKVQEQLEIIENRLLKNPNTDIDIDTFWLLLRYREILRLEEVDSDDSSVEDQELIKISLVLNHNDILKIFNDIYKTKFDLKWVEEKLYNPASENRPYAKKLVHWMDNRCEDKSQLLQEEELSIALDWILIHYKKGLKESENLFIITSLVWEIWNSTEVKKAKAVEIINKYRDKLKEKTNESYALIQESLKWSKAQPDLLEKLLGLVCNTQDEITGDAVRWFEKIVKMNFIDNWENSLIAEHLNEISNYLLKSENHSNLLNTYKKVLQKEDIEAIEQPALNSLLETGLIAQNQNRYCVANSIYKNIFTQQWIDDIVRSENSNNEQSKLDMSDSLRDILDNSVEQWKEELEGIVLVELKTGGVLDYSRNLKNNNSTLGEQIVGGHGEGGAFSSFKNLYLQEALDDFAKDTKSGNLMCSIFMFKERLILSYLMPFGEEDVPSMICYIARPEQTLGSVYRAYNRTIDKIKARVAEKQ